MYSAKPQFLTWVLSALILLLTTINLNWPEKYSPSVIEADAKGYYAWLPAVFIYQDIHFGFFDTVEQKYLTPETWFDYRLQVNRQTVNKYSVGTAFLELPFFLAAHLGSWIWGGPTDGYSYLYPVFISLAALFYALAGLWLLGRILTRAGAGDTIVAIILPVLLFGTNLFYYAVIEPGMSHIYSFFLATCYLLLIQQWAQKTQAKTILAIALVAGCIVLVRPMNVILLASFPLVIENEITFFRQIKDTGIRLLVPLLIFIAIAFIQPLLWYMQTGVLFIDTYPGEHFGPPHLFDFLFSFKKGAFLYTPILLIAVLGLLSLYHKSRFRAIYWFVYMLAVCIILSSWNNWWYGGSFSSRVLVEYLPLFALPLTTWLSQQKKRIPRLIILTVLVMLCQFQIYQYRYYLIHWEDTTRQQYFDNFLKLP
ncbi:MAG: hypothetical protein K1X77_04200 [Bacteroidia bacterium]|jgi:hypothetical protein|nr:hypothetical protein [Bacteroidia bacterium]